MSLEKRLDELDGGPPADLIDLDGRRFGAPDPGRAVDAPRDDLAAIAADRQADHSAGMSAQGEDVIAGPGIPELDRPVVAGRGEAAAVRKVSDGGDGAPWPTPSRQSASRCTGRATRWRASGRGAITLGCARRPSCGRR